MALEEDTTSIEPVRQPVEEPLSVDMNFSIKKRRAKSTTFKIGGQFTNADGQRETDDHVYVFTQPKNAVMMEPLIRSTDGQLMEIGLTKATFDWLADGLSKADSERIIERLYDPTDDLDVDDLTAIVQRLGEHFSGRPTS